LPGRYQVHASDFSRGGLSARGTTFLELTAFLSAPTNQLPHSCWSQSNISTLIPQSTASSFSFHCQNMSMNKSSPQPSLPSKMLTVSTPSTSENWRNDQANLTLFPAPQKVLWFSSKNPKSMLPGSVLWSSGVVTSLANLFPIFLKEPMPL